MRGQGGDLDVTTGAGTTFRLTLLAAKPIRPPPGAPA
jgi:hypothetical protein